MEGNQNSMSVKTGYVEIKGKMRKPIRERDVGDGCTWNTW